MLVVAAMYAMFTRARRVSQPSADVARQGDPRPPILFLRSFLDDGYKLKERVLVAGVPINQPLRMEEALAVRFHDFGPFLAVGEPGEGLPQLGAARAYLSDDQWQAAVVELDQGVAVDRDAVRPDPLDPLGNAEHHPIQSARSGAVAAAAGPQARLGAGASAAGAMGQYRSLARTNSVTCWRSGSFRSIISYWSSSGRMGACACFAAPATSFRIMNSP